MGGAGVIDNFLGTFTRYIDSGFGLLGGEVAFILRMIAESKQFGRQVKWFTTLVSRGDNLPPLYRALTEAGAVKVVKKEMAQGQKQSRFIAWSFMDDNKRRK